MDYSNDDTSNELIYKEEDIEQNLRFFNVLKDGRIHVLTPKNHPENLKVPPTDDPITGVKIKDVKISPDVAVRMFLPPSAGRNGKLPVLLYVHGGAFCMGSAISVEYNRLVTTYVAQSNVLAVSVEYRLFPKHSISFCYEDSWTALRWVASHADPQSDLFSAGASDYWITDYADLNRIFVGGDSAGATISHFLLSNVRKMGLPGNAKIEGLILVHPYFAENDNMWLYMCPINEGPRDPRMYPVLEDLANLCCERVLIFLGEKDVIREGGIKYVEELKKSGWKGKLVFVENKDKEHCFYVAKYMDPEALAMNQRISSFINNENENENENENVED